jgi:hypothetical protein
MLEKIREYFEKKVTLAEEFNEILVDFLGKEATSYSIEPIPTEKVLRPYTDGGGLYQLVFQFGSKEFYDESLNQNIENLNFYERLQNEIEENNNKGVLPEIDGIQSIECLNNGTIQDIQNGTAKYGIQMRITYIKN